MGKNWVLNGSLGIVLGLLMATGLVVVLLDYAHPVQAWHTFPLILAFAVAGGVQGGLLGFFQHGPLAVAVPSLPQGIWVKHTALAGAVLWVLACFPLAFPAEGRLAFFSSLWFWPWLGAVAFAGLMAFGIAQSRILAAFHVEGARRWVRANSIAWVAGTAVTVAVASVGLATKPGAIPEWLLLVLFIFGMALGAVVASLILRPVVRVLAANAK